VKYLKEKYWDLYAGIFLFLFAGALYYGGMTVRMIEISRYGSGFFPKILAILLAITSAIIIVSGYRRTKGADEAQGEEPHWKGILSTFVLMIAYMVLIPYVGFMITTAVYLFLQMNILTARESRKLGMFAVIAVVASVVIYFTFVKAFNLMLPAGILG